VAYVVASNVRNKFVYFGSAFEKNLYSVWNEFGSVRFEKTQFSLDIIVMYYLCNNQVANLLQILQHYCYVE